MRVLIGFLHDDGGREIGSCEFKWIWNPFLIVDFGRLGADGGAIVEVIVQQVSLDEWIQRNSICVAWLGTLCGDCNRDFALLVRVLLRRVDSDLSSIAVRRVIVIAVRREDVPEEEAFYQTIIQGRLRDFRENVNHDSTLGHGIRRWKWML